MPGVRGALVRRWDSRAPAGIFLAVRLSALSPRNLSAHALALAAPLNLDRAESHSRTRRAFVYMLQNFGFLDATTTSSDRVGSGRGLPGACFGWLCGPSGRFGLLVAVLGLASVGQADQFVRYAFISYAPAGRSPRAEEALGEI